MRGRWRRLAQRPLPSMMIATFRGSWLAFSCVLLLLLIAGLETAHTHSGGPANQCSLCVTVHATAPTPTLHSLPVFHAIAVIAIPYRTEGKSTSPELTLFIRPPPASV